MNKYDEATEHVDALKAMSVDDLPGLSGVGLLDCPVCSREIINPVAIGLGYDSLLKLRTWTVAQLISWSALQQRSGIDAAELLERTSGGVMPGIGGAVNGDVGTIGVSDMNGIFVGIEPDGYTHS